MEGRFLHCVVFLCLLLMVEATIVLSQTQEPPSAPTGSIKSPNEPVAERVYSRKDGKIKPPRPIHSPDPGYTREAEKAFPNAKVVIYLIVGSNGLPRDVKVARSVSPAIDQAAVDAANKWKFRPATLDGKPVAVQINIEFPVK